MMTWLKTIQTDGRNLGASGKDSIVQGSSKKATWKGRKTFTNKEEKNSRLKTLNSLSLKTSIIHKCLMRRDSNSDNVFDIEFNN